MISSLRYEQHTTPSDPNQDEGQDLSAGPAVAVVDDIDIAPSDKALPSQVHPVHWLIDGHWLGRWRTPALLKLWRYGAGSIVAFLTSVFAVYACFSWLGFGATTSAVVAFFAGAVPNWILNRRWAWQQRGREGVGRETTLYVLVSVVSLVASTAVTKVAAVEAEGVSHVVKDLLVTGSYTFSIVVLTGLKYFAYDRLVFIDRSRARSSLHQVPTTADPNRNP